MYSLQTILLFLRRSLSISYRRHWLVYVNFVISRDRRYFLINRSCSCRLRSRVPKAESWSGCVVCQELPTWENILGCQFFILGWKEKVMLGLWKKWERGLRGGKHNICQLRVEVYFFNRSYHPFRRRLCRRPSCQSLYVMRLTKFVVTSYGVQAEGRGSCIWLNGGKKWSRPSSMGLLMRRKKINPFLFSGWQILSEKQCLWTAVFKAKYLARQDFLTCQPKARDSYT